MQYLWNNFVFSFFNINVGVEQGSALSLILSTFYLLPIFHIFEKTAKNLKIPVLFLLFVDDGLFISQEKSLEKTNSHLFCNYNVILSLLEQFGLVIKYGKFKVFHFSKLHRLFNLLSLDLSYFRGFILQPKNTW